MEPNRLRSSLDFQGYMQENYPQIPFGDREGVPHPHHATDAFSLGVQEFPPPFPLLESKTNEGLNNYAVDGICSKAVEGGVDKNFDSGKGKEETIWHRMKWTSEMVKVLITAVSYVGEDDSSVVEKRKMLLFPKKGKWRAISDVMVERGYSVSPQQCEDKFNDLNKKYKRLNAILGKGITCDVVENPALMESMDLSEETKGEVKKLLSCKQLFYEQMCSYHNGNTRFLPYDPVLQQSLLYALKGKVKNAKKMRLGEEPEVLRSASPANYNNSNTISDFLAPNGHSNLIQINANGGGGEKLQGEEFMSRSLKLEEEKLKLQAQMLELEKERFEWLIYSQEKDRELQQMKLQNEIMKLENQHEAFKLKRRKLGANDH